jgi:hypothetical protein
MFTASSPAPWPGTRDAGVVPTHAEGPRRRAAPARWGHTPARASGLRPHAPSGLSSDLRQSRAPGTEPPGLWPPCHREPPGPRQTGHPRTAQAVEGRTRVPSRTASPGRPRPCSPGGLARAAGGPHLRAPGGLRPRRRGPTHEQPERPRPRLGQAAAPRAPRAGAPRRLSQAAMTGIARLRMSGGPRPRRVPGPHRVRWGTAPPRAHVVAPRQGRVPGRPRDPAPPWPRPRALATRGPRRGTHVGAARAARGGRTPGPAAHACAPGATPERLGCWRAWLPCRLAAAAPGRRADWPPLPVKRRPVSVC